MIEKLLEQIKIQEKVIASAESQINNINTFFKSAESKMSDEDKKKMTHFNSTFANAISSIRKGNKSPEQVVKEMTTLINNHNGR